MTRGRTEGPLYAKSRQGSPLHLTDGEAGEGWEARGRRPLKDDTDVPSGVTIWTPLIHPMLRISTRKTKPGASA